MAQGSSPINDNSCFKIQYSLSKIFKALIVKLLNLCRCFIV
nr:MAG TPA: hypothetical protein [Caudoviricetes sp.]